MENLVSGQNRLQGVLGGDVITFLKGILIKEIIKSVNIWKGDLTDQIVFLLVKTYEHHFTSDTSSICTSGIDHMTIVKRCMISVKFWHQSRWTDKWCNYGKYKIANLRIGLSSETHTETHCKWYFLVLWSEHLS